MLTTWPLPVVLFSPVAAPGGCELVTDRQSLAFSSQRLWGTVGAACAALAVILGAFGAHGAEEVLTEVHGSEATREIAGLELPASYKYLQDFRTAAQYHMVHSVAIILVGLLGRRGKARVVSQFAAGAFLCGILLFSGSLYLLAMTGMKWLGMVAPLGGICFILGWVLLATAAGMPRTAPGED